MPRGSGFLFLNPVNMRQQLFVIRHAAEIPADHFVGTQCWLAPRPQTDQHARDDRAVGLKFNAVLRITQQVTASQHVLEEAEKDFNRPAIVLQQSNNFRRHIRQVRGDADGAVAVLTS